MKASDALNQLKEGNRRWVAGDGLTGDQSARRSGLVREQRPKAVVLGCSDSRVPAEIVFDQGVGDLFVIRVAGNIASPVVIGSVEFAVTVLEVPLVIVLGHTGCGAVAAAVAESESEGRDLPPNLQQVIDEIRPALSSSELSVTSGEQLVAAVRINTRAAAVALGNRSSVLGEFAASGQLEIVSALYDIASGEVTFDL